MKLFVNPTEQLIEKVTSETLLIGSEDLESYLKICDAIRSKEISSKDVVNCFKKRLLHKSPNAHLLTFQLMDFCAKNGGHHFLRELSNSVFTQFLNEYIKSSNCHAQVKEKALACIQLWGIGFSSESDLKNMTKLYYSLKSEGFPFPPEPNINADFFQSQTPPEWNDSPACMRCRTSFSLTTRKHHCRKCGQTFCSSCSSKMKPLPHLGINKPVRVCDSCYRERKISSPTYLPSSSFESMEGSPLQRSNSSSTHSPVTYRQAANYPFNQYQSSKKSPTENDMQLAIRLSLEEAKKTSQTTKLSPSSEMADEDPLLKAAIAASLSESHYQNESSEKFSVYHPGVSSSSPHSAKQNAYESSGNFDSSILRTPVSTDFNQEIGNFVTESDKEKIRAFALMVRQMETHKEDIGRNTSDPFVKEMYTQVFSLIAKLKREIDNVTIDYNKLVTVSQNYQDLIRSYDQLVQQPLISSQSTNISSAASHHHPQSANAISSSIPYSASGTSFYPVPANNSPQPIANYGMPYAPSNFDAGAYRSYPVPVDASRTAQMMHPYSEIIPAGSRRESTDNGSPMNNIAVQQQSTQSQRSDTVSNELLHPSASSTYPTPASTAHDSNVSKRTFIEADVSSNVPVSLPSDPAISIIPAQSTTRGEDYNVPVEEKPLIEF